MVRLINSMKVSRYVRNHEQIRLQLDHRCPYRFVPFEDVEARVKQFQTNHKSWGAVGGETELAKRMNAHSGGASFIASLMVKQLNRARPVFEYRGVGQPIALLQLDLQDGDVMEIKNVATHLGSLEAGGIMVEYALNKIPSCNAQGVGLQRV